MSSGKTADEILDELEDRVYGELASRIRQADAGEAQKREWILKALQVLCDAEEALKADPGLDTSEFEAALDDLERNLACRP